jgi:quinol monooxygenase YgiN
MHFLLVATLLSVTQAQEKSQEHPLLRVAKESLADSTKPFTLLVRFKIKEGQGPKFEAAAAKAVKGTRKEKGNLAYELSRTAKGTNYVIYERWENLAALDSHLKSAHFKTAWAELDPLLDGDLEVHLLVPVRTGD